MADQKKEIEFLERRKGELEEAVKAKEKTLKNPDLPQEITKLDTLIDILHGKISKRQSTSSDFKPPKEAPISPRDGSEIIHSLVDKFDRDGRSFSFEEMANLVINVQSNFLTVLKGLPGSGKTSSVIKLAEALGLKSLDDDLSDCFLNIPVSRGWVSGRDFLGFYNSLKGIYQPSKTGLYDYLRKSKHSSAQEWPRLILLDEANLSPIEHYWSDFLAMCDPEGRNRPLDTGINGDDRYLKVKENIRFIATINNDNTTEPLSPRLCDRAPIINMDIKDSNVGEQIAANLIDGPIQYDVLQKYFTSTSAEYLSDFIELEKFCEKMESREEPGSPIIVSKRKQRAMSQYCEVAVNYMDQRKAVDFAISQHALPLINGHGSNYKQRLDSLLQFANSNSLLRSSELLENIISNGDSYMGSYCYF